MAEFRLGFVRSSVSLTICAGCFSSSGKRGATMSSTAAIMTVTKMLESLPESVQERVVEHLREYLADLQDELKWDSLFEQTQSQLVTAARRAKQDIVQGRAQPMDDERL
jgi:hypothetical protein